MLTTKQLTIGAGYISAPYFMGVWCNGNTTSSNLVDVGSIPTTLAKFIKFFNLTVDIDAIVAYIN